MTVSAETAYVFRHALLREAAYQLMTPSVRTNLHASAVASFDSLGLARAHARELADHCREAGPAWATRELQFLRDAADDAAAVWDNAAAAELCLRLSDHALADATTRVRALQQASDALDSRGHAAAAIETARRAITVAETANDPPLLCHALHGLGHLLQMASEHAEAGRVLDRGWQIAAACDDRVLQVKILMVLARVALRTGHASQALEHSTRGLALAEQTEDEITALARGSHAFILQQTGASERALPLLTQSLAQLEHSGRRVQHVQVLAGLASLKIMLGQVDEAILLLRQAREQATRIGHLRTVALCSGNLAVALYDLGRLDECETEYRRALAIHRETGSRASEALMLGNLAGLYTSTRRYEMARQAALESYLVAESTGEIPLRCNQLAYLSRGLMHVGRLAAAEKAQQEGLRLAQGRSLPTHTSELLSFRTTLMLHLGRHDEARRAMAAANPQQFLQQDFGHWVRFLLTPQARMALAHGDPDEARRLIALAASRGKWQGFVEPLAGDIAEFDQALASDRPPRLWGGMRISQLSGPLLKALAAALPATETGRAEIARAPAAFAALCEAAATEPGPVPRWDDEDFRA
ncbi:MAG: tetratricopeptide repeat protein [Planctomycetes bacterium]|nr:tetratricopeptide repeat protein [Planctomycetota bacterium]MCL4729685.1 tetratricopeptide repeat protein [Planctomycetota bacterium]